MNNFPKGKFNIIYCDPAWKYDSGFLKRNWSNKYPTMKPEDIYNLPVKNIAKNMKGTIDQRIRRVRKLNIPERSKKDIIRELEHLRTWNTWRSQPDVDSDDE